MAHKFKVSDTTSITVEDLGTTYPGVCDHCSQRDIRYICHIEQHLAKTLEKQPDLAEMGEVHLMDMAQMLEGMEVKQVSVGCVCVAKFLTEEFGVDAELALRMENNAKLITQRLIQLGKMDALLSEPAQWERMLREASITIRLRKRMDALEYSRSLSDALRSAPQDVAQRYYSLRAEVRRDFEDAWKKFRRDHFSVPFSYGGAFDETKVRQFLTRRRANMEHSVALGLAPATPKYISAY